MIFDDFGPANRGRVRQPFGNTAGDTQTGFGNRRSALVSESSPIISRNRPKSTISGSPKSKMSQHATLHLGTKIARYARYDGPTFSIGCLNNFLPRMNVRNGSHGLHLDPQNFEIWGFSGFQPHRRDGLKCVLRVGGPIFGKATN